MTTMPNWLWQRAFLTPERVAIETETGRVTFQELHEQVISLSQQLVYTGVKKGDKVAVLMQNSIHMVHIIHALSYVGAVAVLLNTRLSNEELQWQMKDAEASLLITDEAYQEIYKEFIHTYTVSKLQLLPKADTTFQQEILLEDTMTIIYTSGTTGKPKGVMLTYGNHWWSASSSALHLGLQEDDCWLACLPLFHVGGLSIVMKNVIYGMRVLLYEKFNVTQINQAICNNGVTMISVVAKMLSDMLKELGDVTYPSSLRCVLLGGGPAPKPMLETCVTKQIPVYQTYGMTETASQICTLSSDYMLTKVGSAGKPLLPCQLRIADDGEIIVKGPNVTAGYFKREDATRTSIQNGWLHTGDIGYLDEEGFLYVLDRRSDLIISGGENIYPAQIEEVLLSHSDVEEAGVIGKEDNNWGQVPVAFVKRAEGSDVTEEELIHFCYEGLARYKVPKQIMFISALPRNASKKLLRRKLRELLR
ncbi:o-succinylbenzoate--CoA ligase [Microbacteriaceae bacterium 4G12]